MAVRRRLDAELVRRGLVPSRGDATTLIDAHRVRVNGAIALKPSRQVALGDNLEVSRPPARFVGRGGEKLEVALADFALEVAGLRWLDAGASTGGFTDCLLQRGAAHVVALDVGHGQLAASLRGDERVTVIERQNIRTTTVEQLGGRAGGVVADLSFISLKLVIGVLAELCQPGSSMVLLVKPQFEAGRAEAAKTRGVISDPEVHERVRQEIDDALETRGCRVIAWTDSPIQGAHGNRELFVHAVTPDAAAWGAGAPPTDEM